MAFSIVEKGLTGSVAINFFMAAAMRISMKYVWGIIHFLQIVTCIPLMIKNLPPNFMVMNKILFDLAKLKIIPKPVIL